MNSHTLVSSPSQPLSVGELSLKLKHHFSDHFSSLSVVGEVVSLKCHSSGHWYFALRDEDAVLDAVCWRSNARNMPSIQEGMRVVCEGSLTIYKDRSKYQIVVSRLALHGQGEWLRILEERKNKLRALFEAPKKKLPYAPGCIGVITSPTGAVIQDILHRLTDRFPCHVIVWPVLVQGATASEEICQALKGFVHVCPQPDVLILARGGGSMTDLMPFSEEELVRAIHDCPIPIISAIGHETDVTLADFAADYRAPTPTAAAEKSVPHIQELRSHLHNLEKRLQNAVQSLSQAQWRFTACLQRLRQMLESTWWQTRQSMDALLHRRDQAWQNCYQNWLHRVRSLPVTEKPSLVLWQRCYQEFCHRADRWNRQMELSLQFYSQRLASMAQRLDSLSPKKTLHRGWTYACDERGVPRPLHQAQPYDTLRLIHSQGKVTAWVIKTEKS